MKDARLHASIVAARPVGTQNANPAFTNKVMAAIRASEMFAPVVRTMNVNKKETFVMKLRHLPKLAIIAIAIAALLFIAGTTYAVVQTVSHLSQVKLNKSGTNEFGRKQLTVEFNSCDEQKKQGTTYELKRGSNLSADDGKKVLQAMCDTDVMTAWIHNDPQSVKKMGGSDLAMIRFGSTLSIPDKVKSIQDKKLVLERREKTLPANVRVIENNKEVSLQSLKPGDTVIYFVPAQYKDLYDANNAEEADGAIIFKLSLPPRYYSLDYRSYVHARSACDGNPERTCLQSNGINQTELIVTYGGGLPSMNDPRSHRTIQGRVASYDANSMQLNVGDGVMYTIQTPHNIIAEYNHTKVYTLAGLDTTYAKTNPEDLKITIGDSLEVYYAEPTSEFATTLSWDQISTIGLMVERTVKDLEVLQKY